MHRLCAASDAVAVGMGTVRADAPRLDARDVPTPRGQPRRLAFGISPLPEGSELEHARDAHSRATALTPPKVLNRSLLEGGPTLAGAFADAGLVDINCSSSPHPCSRAVTD